ncbi:DUF4162 domain-containing protein [Lentibacillus jeotgali]|uniref:ATP-binding protein DrrA1-3 family domain-containing protein n=1 Tax=Lentibacillus jeotgali TaxID=558169 RepID=UPI0002625C37|nr:DUF4162 domain-containing protein [Lentibacillus jeotgali]
MIELREKYQTAKIELGFEGDLDKFQEKIISLPAVTDCYIERDLLHIAGEDLSAARREILAAAAAGAWPVTSFAVNRASLEDMFMKAVNS